MTLTNGDLSKITKIVKTEVKKEVRKEIRIEGKVIREQLSFDLGNQIKTAFSELQDRLFTKIDPILKEVLANREERSIMNYKLEKHSNTINSHSKKIKKLEKALNI